MQRRCDRNRKRSKRRAIFCPTHGCYLDSASEKYPLYADRPGQLQQKGISRKDALMLIASQTAIPLTGEWLEAFWCKHCQDIKWYHVKKCDRAYEVTLAPPELWQQAMGVVPLGNPSVSEYTLRNAKMLTYRA